MKSSNWNIIEKKIEKKRILMKIFPFVVIIVIVRSQFVHIDLGNMDHSVN